MDRLSLPALLACGLFLSGCGEEGPHPVPRGTVTGKVTSGGQPVTEGIVSFYNNQKGTAVDGTIGSDGSYTAENVGAGPNTVAVTPPPPPPFEGVEDGKTPPPPKEYPNLPEKYRQASTSGLTLDVKEGETKQFDIDLSP